ncbi:MAG TPA: phosphatase PAP2 family protein [Clostridia bacterium]|nr:phosphatase PAP2 family protein [Clostridia bacterium]
MPDLSQSVQKPAYPSLRDKASLLAYVRYFWRDLVLLAAFFPALSLMELLNRPFGTVHSLEIAFDSKIPLLPWTVLIYHSWAPLIIVLIVFYLLRDRGLFRRYVLAMIVGQLLANVSFLFFQTMVPRPEAQVSQATDIFSRILGLTYGVDNPYCGFPSIHVLLCTLTILFVWQLKDAKTWFKILVSLYFTAVAISTVTTKQHVVLDIPGGIVYALVAFLLTKSLIRLIERKFYGDLYR